MEIHSISIDEGCIVCGACAEICPEVFVIDGECHVVVGADTEFFAEWIEQAAEVCPVDVIRIASAPPR